MYISVRSLLKVFPIFCGSERSSRGARKCLKVLTGSPGCYIRMEVLTYQRYATQSVSQQMFQVKILVHTLYNNTNINIKTHCQNSQSYMCTHPLQQRKHKHKDSFPESPLLHVYIHYTTTQTQKQRIIAKIPSISSLHTLYNNTNINTKVCWHNAQSYMCKYPIQ